MRILGIGHDLDLGDMYLRLRARGHAVRVHVTDPASGDVLRGMIERSASLEEGIAWLREDPESLALFEGTGFGGLQDRLRREGIRVIGGSAFGDRLENDRAFGQAILRSAGLSTANSIELDGFEEAMRYLAGHPGRYVLKFSGGGFASTRSYVGALDDGADLMAVLRLQAARWSLDEQPRIVLMEHLRGVEVGVGGYFNGRFFLHPRNLDWEHKRFFPGNLGELTGEMGTLVSYRGADRLFDATLGRLAPALAQSGYVGYVNLNMIVNEGGPWPLELTCRFGYPGFAILSALQAEPWDALLERMARGQGPTFETHAGYAVGIVLTVPPFPYPDGYERLSKGLPILFRSDFEEADHAFVHFSEVAEEEGSLVTAGQIGYVMVVTGRGETVAEARRDAYARAAKVVIPNVRYRLDIGAAYENADHAELVRLGWLDA